MFKHLDKNAKNHIQTNVIYTDFAKAFDKVNHKKLIEVLFSYGIRGQVLRWIKCFLSNRKQRVYIGDQQSNSLEVFSGVPQGSVIGPLLFVLYIDDIVNSCAGTCEISLFADDSKLYSTNKFDLQKTLDNFLSFVDKRNLKLSLEKCRHLIISDKLCDTTFKLNNFKVEQCTMVKDLGIIISCSLK